jgi:HEAT repeats
MKTKRNIEVLVVTVLTGFVVIYALLPDEPRYQNKTLTKWLEYYYINYGTGTQGYKELPPKEHEALDAIGARAIPTLLSMLKAKDSPTKNRVIQFWRKHGFFKIDWGMQASSQREMAAIGFASLGKEAHAAIPALIKLTNSEDLQIKRAALLCLNTIDPDAQTFLPVLAQHFKDEDDHVRAMSAIILRNRFPEEAERLGVYQGFPWLKRPAGRTNVSNNLTNSR